MDAVTAGKRSPKGEAPGGGAESIAAVVVLAGAVEGIGVGGAERGPGVGVAALAPGIEGLALGGEAGEGAAVPGAGEEDVGGAEVVADVRTDPIDSDDKK